MKRVKESFYDTKGENSFMLFSGGAAVGAATAEAFGGGFAGYLSIYFF